ncbi:MAG: hypothetical protein HWN68_16185, partial [Desulfobacterales bacterium]|nr:hypothetical protein [Desulfobacterales bacterium]
MGERNNKDHESKIDPTGWMVTFGDLLMLLLTFFVMLMSMSTTDKEAFKSVLESFSVPLGQSSGLDGMDASSGLMHHGGAGVMGHSDSQRVRVTIDRTDK